MKPIDILDALSDLPEEYAASVMHGSTAQEASVQEEKTQTSRGGIFMKQHTSKAKSSTVRFSKAGIAAAVAVCIGLNAALIFGISRIKNDSGALTSGTAPEIQDLNRPYMELIEALPTGILFRITSSDEELISYNPRYIVMQDGKKISDCKHCEVYFESIAKGSGIQQLNYEQLPSGSYTLVNLAADGETEGILGHLDFEISAEFDSMIYIPDVRGMNYDESKVLLEEKGVTVSKKGVVNSDLYTYLQLDDVVFMELPTYQVTEKDTTNHFDGEGYWVHPGDPVTLQVKTGADGDPAAVPYVVGQDFEAAKIELLNRGFTIDKRNAYSDEFPEGTVMEEKIDNTDVPEEGAEAAVGTFVRITVSLGTNKKTVIMPDMVGMDWETAKKTAKEAGILLAKQPCEPDGKAPGTVIEQNAGAGQEYTETGWPVRVLVTIGSDTQDIPMTFTFPDNKSGFYFISIRNADGETIGNSPIHKVEGAENAVTLYAECSEEGTPVQAVLVNAESWKEYLIGTYLLHPDTATYDTITEDMEEAFRQVQ